MIVCGFFTGESVRADFNVADYSIDFDFLDFGDRHFRLPLPFLHFPEDMELVQSKHIWASQSPESRSKFCGFMAANPAKHSPRNMFFDKLCQYKKVDSGGKWKNNIGKPVGDKFDDFSTSKREWLKGYKFNLCFENTSYPGYFTEKLFQAFSAGCIPIYWGDTSLRCDSSRDSKSGDFLEFLDFKGVLDSSTIDFSAPPPMSFDNRINQALPVISPSLIEYKINPKSFINAHNFATWDDLIEEIKRIDNDDEAYLAMLKEPVFLDDFDAVRFYEKRLERFFDYIFLQAPALAFRRGAGSYKDPKSDILAMRLGRAFLRANTKFPRWIRFYIKAKKVLKEFGLK